MLGTVIKVGLVGVVLAVAVQALVASNADDDRVAEENHLDADQSAAYRSCRRDMAGKTMSFGGVTHYPVPKGICVCQAREMATIFLSGQYSSHKNVVNYLTDRKERKPLKSKDLKFPANPDGEFKRLESALIRCVVTYNVERERRGREQLDKIRQGRRS